MVGRDPAFGPLCLSKLPANPLLAILAVGLGTTIVPLDSSVNIAFPDITRSFGIPLDAIQWVVICYVLTYSSLMLVCGKLGDLFGHRRIFRIGLALSIVAFALCGSAGEFGWLLFFRFCQGVGAALVISCSPALATACYPEEQRAKALGLYTALFGIGSVIGPSLGGIMVEAWGWPAVFWFRAPISLLALAATWLIPSPPQAGARKPFDVLGAVLLALALSTLLLAINQAQSPHATALIVAVLAVLSILGFAGFVYQEIRFAEPIIRLGVFRDIEFSILNLANLVANLVGFGVLLLVPYYLIRMAEFPTWLSGIVLGCAPLGVALAGPPGGWAIGRIGARRVALAGAILLTGGLFAVSQWQEDSVIPVLAASLLLHGLGLGLFHTAYMHIVTGTLSREDRGVAGSLGMMTRSAGVVTGAAVLAGLFASIAPAAGFLPAFQTVFHYAGLGFAVFVASTLLRPGLWFRSAER